MLSFQRSEAHIEVRQQLRAITRLEDVSCEFRANGKRISNRRQQRLKDLRMNVIHSFIHSGHFYSASSSPLPLSGAPDYSTDTVSEFHAEAHRQLQVKDFPKVPTWRLERESNPRPSG